MARLEAVSQAKPAQTGRVKWTVHGGFGPGGAWSCMAGTVVSNPLAISYITSFGF